MIKKNRLIFLIVLSGICLMGGVGGAYIQYSFDKSSSVLFIVGSFCALVAAYHLLKVKKVDIQGILNKRAIIKSLTLIFILGFLVRLNYWVSQNDIRVDVTQYKQHTLTRYTNDLLHSLESEIKITALYVGMPPKYLEDLLNEYQRQSNETVKFEIIDPLVNIGYAAQFGQVIKGNERKLVVESSGQRQDIDFTKTPLDEELLNNAILRVTRKPRKVYFLTGHGEFDIFKEDEAGYSTLAKLLKENNINSESLFLASKKSVPDDCAVLIIAGAKKDFEKEERKIINEYLSKGGDALFLIENVLVSTPDKPLTEEELSRNPSFNEILNIWGIKINDDIVIDTASHASGDVGSPATKNYLAHREIIKKLDYTFYIRPRSISLLSERRRTLKLAPFILTASTKESWGETDRYLNIKYDEGVDRPGPVPIGYIIFEQKGELETAGTRIAAITDGDFLTNNYIGSYSNAQMGLSLINWLTEMDYQVLLGKKDIEVKKLELNSKQKRVVKFILVIIPVLIGILGIVVWINQTNNE